MNKIFFRTAAVAILSFVTLTGFTCSKRVPTAPPSESSTETTTESNIPQEQMTDQSQQEMATPQSGDATTTN